MPSRDLNVDPVGVRAAGATAESAACSAPPTGVTVTACAADVASVQVAARLAGRIGELNVATESVNIKTGAASQRLHGDAESYETQDAAGASSLGGVYTATTAAGAVSQVPAPVVPAVPQPPGVPAGVIPTTGREISAIMHSGPGPQALQMAAGQLDSRAAELEQAADTVRAARVGAEQSWQSGAADVASTHLQTVESTYTRQASHARSLSREARAQVDNFMRAKSQIPDPQVFVDLEHRLLAAYAANAHPTSRGKYAPVIADLEHALAAINQEAVRQYERYKQAAQIDVAKIDPDVESAPSGDQAPAPSTDAGDPAGTGGDEETNHAGQDTQTLEPAGDPLAAPAAFGGDAATGLLQMVLPTVLGGVAGAAGGVLGALAGAGQQVQQAGTQLASGLAQGAGTAMSSALGKPSDSGPATPQGGGEPSLDGFEPELGGPGGGEPGGTEPASGAAAAAPPGALSAPAGAAAVPAAAPSTFSAPAAPSVGAASPGVPMGGGMIPPMMPMGARPRRWGRRGRSPAVSRAAVARRDAAQQ